jgi:hypothetical protein
MAKSGSQGGAPGDSQQSPKGQGKQEDQINQQNNQPNYENPEEETSSSDFAEPIEEEAAAAEGAEVDSFAGVDETLLQVFREVEAQFSQQTDEMDRGAYTASSFEGSGNIVGVGIGVSGLGMPEGMSQETEPGAAAINIYVVEPMTSNEARSAVVNALGVSAADSDTVPINVVVTGVIDAQPHRWLVRPAPGGVSTAHYKVTAGTLGCLSIGRSAPRNSRLMVLSNNHVLANSNDARLGDPILQPGPYDGGKDPADRIAILERFVPISFAGGANYVDAATGWAWPDRVRRELVYVSNNRLTYFRVGSQPVNAQVNMLVGKSGRTTQLTVGRVVDVNASIRVNYGGGRVALFRDQIVIQGVSGTFSAGGDSGSLIWTWNSQRNPVGLLFAGGGGYTIANKIGRVLAALDIRLYT